MRWISMTAVLLVASGFLTAADKEKTEANKDLKRLQGTWTTAKLLYNGKDFLADGKGGFEMVIKGDIAVVQGNAKVKKEYARIKLKLDTRTNPRVLDMVVAGGSQKDAVIEGIYELKGDQLRICAKVFGNKERPTEFDSPAGKSIVLLVLKRAKP